MNWTKDKRFQNERGGVPIYVTILSGEEAQRWYLRHQIVPFKRILVDGIRPNTKTVTYTLK